MHAFNYYLHRKKGGETASKKKKSKVSGEHIVCTEAQQPLQKQMPSKGSSEKARTTVGSNSKVPLF
jgi:hypothetical protein